MNSSAASCMSSETVDMLDSRAADLLRSIVDSQDATYGSGNMSCAVYDTAWLSMIKSPHKDSSFWLFPQSFQYVLDSQQPSGGWDSETTEPVDKILNSLAGLLALQRHFKEIQSSEGSASSDIIVRIYNAAAFLQKELQSWIVELTTNVGFELLIPTHLDLLEKEGLFFEFPGRAQLWKIREGKLARFHPEMLYGKKKATALHSLEAFIGQIDFDRVRHQTVLGSMMASPSSTAAYLIYSSDWDDQAESYLRHVLLHGPGQGDGNVGSAFPSTLFEITWVITTLAMGDFDIVTLGGRKLNTVRRLMQKAFDDGDDLIGFAPGVGDDADDTAKGIVTMKILGDSIDPQKMISKYEQQECFKTYPAERNPSFTTNCNVLIALLCATGPLTYESQIQKLSQFLCDQWHKSVGLLLDKWNTSPYYPLMLMSQALTGAVRHWHDKKTSDEIQMGLEVEVTRTLWQALIRTLQAQKQDGSWGEPSSREGTAYALLAVKFLSALPAPEPIESCRTSTISRGREYLMRTLEDASLVPERLWVEKVTYGCSTLSKAYILAALNARPAKCTFKGLSNVQKTVMEQPVVTKTYARLPSLAATPHWLIMGWQIEAALYTSWLKETTPPIFPGMSKRGRKYIGFIPFTWVVGNNLYQPPPLSSEAMATMMLLSLLIYQVDEFMESVVARQSSDAQLGDIRRSVDAVFTAMNNKPLSLLPLLNSKDENAVPNLINGLQSPPPSAGVDKSTDEDPETLGRFVKFVINHPLLPSAPATIKQQLQANLQAFLQAHLTQLADNRHLQQSESSLSQSSSSLLSWVRSTSANHTGGPFAFYFLLALLPHNYQLPPTAVAKYVAEDVNRRSATLCRLYNDLGSMQRDRAEGNLNSADFFSSTASPKSDEEIKTELLELAKYEKHCLHEALSKLKEICMGGQGRQMAMWRAVKAFVDVTDLYGQMYLIKDLTPSIQNAGRKRKAEHDDVE